MALADLPLLQGAKDQEPGGIKLGVASYSLRKLTRPQAIDAVKSLRTPYLNIKDVHLSMKATPEEIAAAKKEFDSAGIQIVGGGTINLQKDDDATMKTAFEYAKAVGMPLMVIAPTQQSMPRVERFVKEYNIKVAIHNHGPEDKFFPAPKDVLAVVKSMDPRVGLCIDVGHTARTGTDPVQAIREAGPRLLDMHIKDLKNMSDKNSQCDVGDGAMPIVGIFRQLRKMNYQGCVNLEYEINESNPLPGMQKSFSYMRGVLAGLAG